MKNSPVYSENVQCANSVEPKLFLLGVRSVGREVQSEENSPSKDGQNAEYPPMQRVNCLKKENGSGKQN
jgi:hypothetical protein